MQQPLRLGFVGAGNLAQAAHLPAFSLVPGCRIVALAEVRPQLAALVAARHGIPSVYTDPLEMVRREKIDALVTVVPQQFHLQILVPLFECGLPMFCEKALAINLDVAQKIVAARQASSVPFLMVAHHKRSDPAVAFAREKIAAFRASGELGPLRYLRLQFSEGNWQEHGLDGVIKTDEPGPSLKNDDGAGWSFWACPQSCHQVNLLHHLLGESFEVDHVSRDGRLLVGHARDVPVAIEAMFFKTSEHWHETAHIAFEKGCIDLELPAPLAKNRPGKARLYRDKTAGANLAGFHEPALPALDAMRLQAENFVRAARGETAPSCTDEDALADMRAMAAYHALRAR